MKAFLGRIVAAPIFYLFYALLTPLRHPYFSSTLFIFVLFILILSLSWMLSGNRMSLKLSLVSSLLGYIASVAAAVTAWCVELWPRCLISVVDTFEIADFFWFFLVMPALSYAFLLAPLSMFIAGSIQKRMNPGNCR